MLALPDRKAAIVSAFRLLAIGERYFDARYTVHLDGMFGMFGRPVYKSTLTLFDGLLHACTHVAFADMGVGSEHGLD